MGENKMIKLIDLLKKILLENDPKTGTGKKPKGSGRRLYTDENPKDTVSIKFKTKEDIVDTLNKDSFKSKSHARQSQIINLIHQRVRAAYSKAKDPEVKYRLKRALDYIENRKESSKEKTQRLNKLKETSNPQSGKAAPYGSGYAPVKELVTDTEVICDNCGWKWKIADGGDDLYICHKCNHDNTPK
jgi:cell division protein FtsN